MMLPTTLMETLTEFKALLLNKEQQKSSLFLLQILMIRKKKPLHLDHELAAAVAVVPAKKVNLVLICQIFLRRLQVASLHLLSCQELLLPVGQLLLLVNLSKPRLQQHL